MSSLLLFTSLDNKIFDLFLRILPPLEENEKVIILTLDDDSVNMAGGFPFRREVMADVVILLKELGVETIVFDLSYLDESPYRLDPDYANQVFSSYLNSGFSQLDEASMAAIDLIGTNISRNEKELFREDIRYLHETVRNDLESSLSFLIRNVDEYFAEAIAFSGSSWLTLTMIRPEDTMAFIMNSQEEIALMDPEMEEYLANNISSKNIISKGDSKTREMAGIMPAIFKLLSRSRGAGFVNAMPDPDGLLRRVNLLFKYKNSYYSQLAFETLKEKLGVSQIEVTNAAINLILDNGKNMRIPRAEDGSMLLKWPKKTFYNYNIMSLVDLVRYTLIESILAQNVSLMYEDGFFSYWDKGVNAFDYHNEAEAIKSLAFANNSAAGDEWFSLRENYFSSLEDFLYGPYEDYIITDVAGNEEITAYVKEMFAESRNQFTDLAEIRLAAASLKGSYCVIGSDATSMQDNGLNTYQENFPLVGMYTAIANMFLSGDFIDDAPFYVSIIIALVYSLLIAFLLSRFETHLSIITGLSGLVVLCAAFAGFFYITKIYPGFAVPLISTAMTFILMTVIKFLAASREKSFLHNAFSRYLAPEIITEIINDPGKLNLGGEKREMTALFTDIQGFSAISEQIDPAQLVKLLNRYLTALSNIVMENLGTIDKYVGDAIVAFYGAPVFREDHAVLACRSAIEMKAAEKEINMMLEMEKLSPMPLFTRIGINSGEMVVGNMGAENKMDYTIMGNAVNLAARLEGVNKQYKTGGILISEYTRNKIGDEFLLRPLDRVRVVGINTPLRLYELLDFNETPGDVKRSKVELWEKGIDYYEGRQFREALKIFASLYDGGKDNVAGVYGSRCKNFINNPPPDNWDAVNNLTEK